MSESSATPSERSLRSCHWRWSGGGGAAAGSDGIASSRPATLLPRPPRECCLAIGAAGLTGECRAAGIFAHAQLRMA